VAHYVLSLSGSTHDPIKAVFGKGKFGACMACHGADGKGNQALGAPNLTDKIWLFGGSADTIMETIRKGRNTTMPAFEDFLGDAKVHVLAAYVWSLSNEPNEAPPPVAEK
jgi:cytochrome c oxidase cbb3-type subunit 3